MKLENLRGVALYRKMIAWAAAELEASGSFDYDLRRRNQLDCAKRLREVLRVRKWEKKKPR